MAMIDQVNVIGQNHFELIPKLGDQIVLFGDEKDLEKKFQKFKLFYKKIVPEYGWKKYNKIKLYYDNQIVASIRGKEDVVADSLRTMAMMKAMAEYNLKMSADSNQSMIQDNASNTTDESLIIKSFQRDDIEEAPISENEKSDLKTSQPHVVSKVDSSKNDKSVVKKIEPQKNEKKPAETNKKHTEKKEVKTIKTKASNKIKSNKKK